MQSFMPMRKFILGFLFSVTWTLAAAQELNCKVTINADQVSTSDRGIFKDMERGISTFMNTRKWTTDIYKSHERINCSIFLNISKMPSIGSFVASAQVT